jgi:hypothetical protein
LYLGRRKKEEGRREGARMRARSENLVGSSTILRAINQVQRGEDARHKALQDEYPTYLRKKGYTRCACGHPSGEHSCTTHNHGLHYPKRLG